MIRRKFIGMVGAGIATGGLLMGCSESDKGTSSLKAVKSPPFSWATLHARLDELLLAYESKGMNVAPSLQPPISRQELVRRCRWFPGELPEEIVSLYAWRGGQRGDAWDNEFPFWFRDNTFSTPEIARDEYASMMESYGAIPFDHAMLKYSFPFAAFNGGWYVFPTRTHHFESEFSRPIVSVMEGVDVHYVNIESMVATCVDWVRHDAYEPGSRLSETDERKIWSAHNPGLFDSG